jgi:hypothetical protein
LVEERNVLGATSPSPLMPASVTMLTTGFLPMTAHLRLVIFMECRAPGNFDIR